MEINDQFFHSNNNYNEELFGDYENDIIEYINQYDLDKYNEIISKDKRTNIVNIFSEMRTNILKWYNFDNKKKILEIGANYGEVTQELVKKSNNVTAIEFSKNKIDCISKRLNTATNLKLILCTYLTEVQLTEKYDYIVLIGIGEYAKKIGFNNLTELLNWGYEHLEENGKIFLAIDNKFGAKYLAGSTRNKNQRVFANFQSYIEKEYKLYGKNELEEIIQQTNFKEKYKFYYPVPNYYLTNIIYTDNFLPKQNRYDIYYREDEELLFNELSLIEESIKNKKFDFFSNSYLIELNKKIDNQSNICYVNYSNMRKQEYKIMTQITTTDVIKESYTGTYQSHISQVLTNIENIKKLGFITCEKDNGKKILSQRILKNTMDEYLQKLLLQRKENEFFIELDKWYNFIKKKIKKITDIENTIFEKYQIKIKNKQKLTFLEDGYLDLVFQNIFYEGDDEYIIFDQEWYERAVPIEFIMYRAIEQLFFKHDGLDQIIDKRKIQRRYNIEDYIIEFEKLEKKWQEDKIDKDVLSFYSEKWKQISSIEDIKYKYNQELGKIYNEKDELQIKKDELKVKNENIQKKLELLTEKNFQLSKELEILKNSRFYKIRSFFYGKRKEK